ncbi:hypothetical protein NQ317_013945 [Molorchus minor]|uniref:PHD-type domain-containing protein n=1 Tax=Molorchus minor TaxID=1323400 RepID=A0ABQ9JXY1_9CUCU|nr:hypothetical protein NQ317_013945 [Molorchus minor]
MADNCNLCVDSGGRSGTRGTTKIGCFSCKKRFHVKCLHLSADAEKTILTPGVLWSCTECCQNINPNAGNTSTLQKILDKLNKIEGDIGAMKNVQNEVIESVKFYGDKIDDFALKISEFEDTLKTMKNVKQDVNTLRNDYDNIKKEMDNLQQFSRNNNIEIAGLPEGTNENIIQVVENIFIALGCNINSDAIDWCHRVAQVNPRNKNPRNVIVKFAFHKHKQEVIGAIRKKKG